jgi:hypothetical protein
VFAGQIHAGQVDADDVVPDRNRQAIDGAVICRRKYPCVRAQDIKPAVPGTDGGKGGLDLRFLADIDRHGQGIAPGGADHGGSRFGSIALPVQHGDLAALFGQPQRSSLTDARSGPGDGSDLVRQATHLRTPPANDARHPEPPAEPKYRFHYVSQDDA